MRLLSIVFLAGCGSEWFSEDLDGDGVSVAQGDCFDNPDETAPNGLTAADIYPGKTNETYYDGVDENCDGASDFDKDGDGVDAAEYADDPNSSGASATDCWDDPDTIPEGFSALSGYYQPLAKEVLPGVDEVWYDGVDENCDGASDFDQDSDGHASLWHEDEQGEPGDDCLDSADDPWDNPAGLDESRVNPSETETWYDGTDQNCDYANDYDQDGDGYELSAECDDTDQTVFPNDSAEHWYDGIDGNCDGLSDYDQDGDGFDSADYGGDDCNDDPASDALAINGYDDVPAVSMNPDAVDAPYDGVDADCAGDTDFDADGDGQDADDVPDAGGGFGTDCDDGDGTVYTGAPETWYDGIDGDCSATSDYDQDRDGYDSSDYGFGTHDDCNDSRSSVHPGAAETCTDVSDEDCDGSANDADATGCSAFYNDADGDGYGNLSDSLCLCEAEGTYDQSGVSSANDDCNDGSSSVNPGVAIEDCATSSDDNCDGSTNELDATNCEPWFVDADGDGYGGAGSECWCAASGDYAVANADDCDDADASRKPGAAETCDGEDDDCDGSIDEFTTHWYTDSDEDGFGDDATESCTSSVGAVSVAGDCNDDDARVYPAAEELCDLQQNDCDATTWSDADEDGLVAFADEAGIWSDETSEWAAGTAASPVVVSLQSGSYQVCRGTFYVSLAVSNQIAAVTGMYGAGSTTLDYNGGARTVVTATNATLALTGLTITGGAGTTAGAYTYGGGVMSFATTATSVADIVLEGCEITGNTASYGAGIASYSYGTVEMVESDVHDNIASVAGGGLYVQKGDISCTDGGVNDNTAGGSEGGGAWFGYQQGHVYSTNCDWNGNSPDDLAGTGSLFTTVPDATYGSAATFSCFGYNGCAP